MRTWSRTNGGTSSPTRDTAVEWRRVFRVESSQSAVLWEAFAELAASARVTDVRPTAVGIRCEMRTEPSFNGRTAMVMLGWWYDQIGDAPRLVTAYPTP